MAETYSLLQVMVRDHRKIEKLLDTFEEHTKGEYDAMVASFNTFAWELEKHVFVEEKAIFTAYHPEDVVYGYKMLPELTKQHNVILNKLEVMRKDIRNRRVMKDVYGFGEFLRKHRAFEEEHVYPKLDQALTEQQKKHVIDRINEVLSK